MRLLLILLCVFTFSAWAARDPTEPPNYQSLSKYEAESGVGNMKVQAIFAFKKNPTAIIAGKTVKVGGVAYGLKVLAISPETVTVEDELGETKSLHLFESLSASEEE
jgi:MSHA biogenesis protein MshK